MITSQLLKLVVISLFVILGLLIGTLVFVNYRLRDSKYQEQRKYIAMLPKKKKNQKWFIFASKMYPYMRKIPVVKTILARIRKRFLILHAGDERIVRSQSASVTLIISSTIVVLTIVSFIWTNSWSMRLSIFLVAVYIGSFLSDMFIAREEKKLLHGLSELCLDIRHEYHQTYMVGKSIEQAAERSKTVVANHARKINGVLNAIDTNEELRLYYDVAPNRYLKLLAGISHNIAEYGDTNVHEGEKSLYLQALGNIREEIHLDITRRNRLDNLLAGIVFIALSPVFMLEPIKNWAESQFPIVSDFYNSAFGLYTLIGLYLIYIGCFFGLRVIKGMDGDSQTVKEEGEFLRQLLRIKWIHKIVERFVPAERESSHFRTMRQIREASSKLTLSQFYLQKLLFALVIFTSVIVVQFYIHATIKHNMMYPNIKIVTGGNQPSSQVYIAEQKYYFEANILQELRKKELPEDLVVAYINEQLEQQSFMPRQAEREKLAEEIGAKFQKYNQEYYRWYELLIAFAVALSAYRIPNLLLMIRRQMRRWEMQNEVDGYNSIVMMLSKIERISVFEMIDWLHRYSYIFESQLLRCLLEYEAGAWQALERLKDECNFVPLERIVDRLQVAAELIPIKDAFDDMEQERVFAMDQRKLHYEIMVSRKSTLGKLIGFLPLQATFVMYLLVPFGYLAFVQLGELNVVTNTM
ncbi:hypothetical protein [Paenibacillus guangzhouensis]|uniref:hypothetical protein n=1 Tax=Paenibacillus guangzhouensis TaxID=1473112 RepID=UPI001266909B|nr:hypothetical protein [Paenibacillus guangzhouensis]